ncbi:hypothetical protein KP509_39G061000 [Ceratopteris richardii]|uniref:Uncharacterized protein n=1 Tax=Ceratopteris richardii TaxID=49495 RepID=A0A8T2Q1V2_CERRI|nr:hypothetical protein KP509_39G061000 [Ceratopteris richardii]
MGLSHSLSCHAASSCTAVIPLPASAVRLVARHAETESYRNECGSFHRPPAPAKVLLLDGRILHISGSLRALEVLERFHNHCLCLLDSVSQLDPQALSVAGGRTITTFFQPVSLPPDELLQSDRVYILLPQKTFRMFATAAAAAIRNRGATEENYRAAPADAPRKLHTSVDSNSTETWLNDFDSPKCKSKGSERLRRSSQRDEVYAHRRRVSRRNSFAAPSDDKPFRSMNGQSSACIRRCKSWQPTLHAIKEVHS